MVKLSLSEFCGLDLQKSGVHMQITQMFYPECSCWWLVRVSLVVGFDFCPKLFVPVKGPYKCHLLFCEHRWDGDCTWRWWGHLNTTQCKLFFNFLWWGPKNLVQTALAPLTLLAPLCIFSHPLAPLHFHISLTPRKTKYSCTGKTHHL